MSRTTMSETDRAKKLKALGNAVCPPLVYEVLTAIAATAGEAEVVT